MVLSFFKRVVGLLIDSYEHESEVFAKDVDLRYSSFQQMSMECHNS
jgi:hypothetical protein